MSRTVYYYQYQTPNGPVTLSPDVDGRYKVLYQEENLGSYHSAAAAADDVAGGHVFTPSDGTDFTVFNIPGDLSEWEAKVFATIHKLRGS